VKEKRGLQWRKRRRTREKKASRIVGSFFSFMRVPPSAMCRRYLPVLAFHPVLTDVGVN